MHLLYCTSHVRTYIMHRTLYVYAFMYGIHVHWYMHIFGVPEYSYVRVHVCVHVFAPIHFRLVCIHMYVCTYIQYAFYVRTYIRRYNTCRMIHTMHLLPG